MKILLVEDDIEISTMLKNFLITENFEVITALDGESACEKFFSDNFSLVLLDLMIPKMNMCVFIGAKFMQSSFAIDFDIGSLSFYIQLILKSVVIVSMSFIALFVGMAMKSSKATIITSFLLIFLTQANVGDFTLANNAIFPIVLTIISLGFAVLSVYNAESKDLL